MSIAEKLVTVAQNQQKVFDAGKKSEYDRFWDEFQEYGNRASYTLAFGYGGWTDEIYNPKYTIRPTSCNSMFGSNTQITDTKVDIDLTHPGGNQKFSLFAGASKLKTIRKLIVNEANTFNPTGATSMFSGCKSLENITFEGTIGKSIDFSDCPLSVESMLNVIEHLANYGGTENEHVYTVKFTDDCWEALETSQFNIPNGLSAWKEYVQWKGWSI